MITTAYEKTGEFWMAFAGNQLTSSVSILKRDNVLMIKVKIGGLIEEESLFVTKPILAIIESKDYNLALIDIRDMVIIDGVNINEDAIECLISIINLILTRNLQTFLVVDDKYIRDVIRSTLSHHRRFSRISICSSQEFSEDKLL